MAGELVKGVGGVVARQGVEVMVKAAKKAGKKAAKKTAKKSVKGAAGKGKLLAGEGVADGLGTAFHHMQRAAVVISLMEKGTGEDLRELLARGVKLYEKAAAGDGDKGTVLRAIGVLRAAEHLAMAGLYDARHKHRERVEAPRGPWLEGFAVETDARLARLEAKDQGKGKELLPAAVELVRRAQEAAGDPHLAYELAMAADALCFALENGL